MTTPTAQPVNIICPEGDLLLRVARNGKENLLLVSSQVLIKASGNFSRLLQMRRRPTTQPFAFTSLMTELQFPDDDGDALLTICNILHGRHQEVPVALSLDTLKDIASSCNRHQLTSALLAWSSKWLDHAWSHAVGNEVYTIVAVAVDLGVSATLDKHDTCRSYKPVDIVNQDLAGVTRLFNPFPIF